MPYTRGPSSLATPRDVSSAAISLLALPRIIIKQRVDSLKLSFHDYYSPVKSARFRVQLVNEANYSRRCVVNYATNHYRRGFPAFVNSRRLLERRIMRPERVDGGLFNTPFLNPLPRLIPSLARSLCNYVVFPFRANFFVFRPRLQLRKLEREACSAVRTAGNLHRRSWNPVSLYPDHSTVSDYTGVPLGSFIGRSFTVYVRFYSAGGKGRESIIRAR